MTLLDMLRSMTLSQIERWAVEDRVNFLGWDKRAVAASLGICLKTLYNKLSFYRLKR